MTSKPPQQLLNDGRCPDLATNQYTRSEVRCKAEIKDRGNKSYGRHKPSCLHPHQIMDLKVTKVQHQLPHQCPSMSERSGGSRHPCHGQWPCREPRGHMKINLPVFKDEDTKDAITYQSWHWDLTVYRHAGCWDHTLLPMPFILYKVIWGSVRSSGTDILLDDVLTILDEHYNNVKAFGCFESGTLSSMNGWERQYWTGGVPVETPPGSCGIIPRTFPSGPHNWAEVWPFYGGLPKWLKAMLAYQKPAPTKRRILIISRQQWRLRRKRWWNHLVARWLTIHPSLRQWASFLYESWKAPSLLRPLQCGWHTCKKTALTKKRVLREMTPMESRAWQRSL